MLAAGLPAGARVYVESGSDMAWGSQEWMLRNIAHLLDLANFQRGGGKGTQPDPMDTPSEAAARRTAVEKKRLRSEQAKQRHIERMKARKAQRGG